MHSYPRPAPPTNVKPEVNANEIHLGHWVLARNRKFAKSLVINFCFDGSSSFESSWSSNLGEWSNAQYKSESPAMTKQFDSKHFNTNVDLCLPA